MYYPLKIYISQSQDSFVSHKLVWYLYYPVSTSTLSGWIQLYYYDMDLSFFFKNTFVNWKHGFLYILDDLAFAAYRLLLSINSFDQSENGIIILFILKGTCRVTGTLRNMYRYICYIRCPVMLFLWWKKYTPTW